MSEATKLRGPIMLTVLTASTFMGILLLCHFTEVERAPREIPRLMFIGGTAGLVAGIFNGWRSTPLALKVLLQSLAAFLAGLAYLAVG